MGRAPYEPARFYIFFLKASPGAAGPAGPAAAGTAGARKPL